MPKVDVAILRLATVELLYMDDIPDAVAINEAVDMAKKYGADESKAFINGILGKIAKEKDA
jgi:N utilization substance protein B